MPSFTVHTPAGRRDDEQAVFVSDGWSWPAFVFGPFWLAWRRQWLGLIGYVILWVGLTLLGRYLGLSAFTASLLSMLLNVGLALEAGQILRWTLSRRGSPAVAVVQAPNIADAEVKYFVAARAEAVSSTPTHVASPAMAKLPMAAHPPSPSRAHTVLGSFPEPGGR